MTNELELEELSDWKDYLTVGRLRKALENLPDDGKVLIQRVEDSYYEGSDISGMRSANGILPPGSKAAGWKVVLKKGEFYHQALKTNQRMREEIERRARGEEPHYSIDDPSKMIADEELLEKLKEQYSPAWCWVRYEDDPKNLYIDLHY